MYNEKITWFKPRGFIEQMADFLLDKSRSEEDITNFIVILPNRRSGIYLKYFIGKKLAKTAFLPTVFSIDDFVDYYYESFIKADVKFDFWNAVYLLFEIFKEKSAQELDFWDFVLFGGKIFNDLEEFKMFRLDSHKLREVFYGLDFPEKSILRFFLNSYPDVYEEFFKRIRKQGFSTRSSRYFDVADRIDPEIDLRGKKIFINPPFLLTPNEKIILEKLEKADDFYLILQDVEPVRESFGKSDRSGRERISGDFLDDLRVTLIPTDDDISEIFVLGELLRKMGREDLNSIKTGVVLPDASKLIPVIDLAIPESTDFNVSMGYPLRFSSYFSFFKDLKELFQFSQFEGETILFNVKRLRFFVDKYLYDHLGRANGFCNFLDFLMEEGYTFVNPDQVELLLSEYEGDSEKRLKIKDFWKELSELLFSPLVNAGNFSDFVNAILNFFGTSPANLKFRIKEEIEGLAGELISQMLAIKNSLLSRINLRDSNFESIVKLTEFLMASLRTVYVPLKGTPLYGLQVIGFLESRLLSFDNLFIIDVQEDLMRFRNEEDSLLTTDLRFKLGIQDFTWYEKLSSYMFFTLIGASKDCYIIYKNSNFDEPSHLILMLDEFLKGKVKLDKLTLKSFYLKGLSQSMERNSFRNGVPKDDDIMKKLESFQFSYSAIETYLQCPIRFLFQYVMRIKEERGDEFDKRVIGQAIHEIVEQFFSEIDSKLIKGDAFERKIKEVAEEVLKKYYPIDTPRIRLLKEGIKRRLWNSITKLEDTLEQEIKGRINGEFSKYLTEVELRASLRLGDTNTVYFKGTIDRVDIYEDGLVIIDYKTGSSAKDYLDKKTFDNVINQITPCSKIAHSIKNSKLQLFLYLWLYRNHIGNILPQKEKVFVSIFPLKSLSGEIKVDDLSDDSYLQKTEELLQKIVKEILDLEIPFYPPLDKKLKEKCRNCNFKVACNNFSL